MPESQTAPSFGRYEDPVMLGAGGMGAVYRARDPSLDRYVAIKVLTKREQKSVERFRREAQVLAKIVHPSIVQIYEIVGSGDGRSDPYIVMEYFPGTPLDQLVKAGPVDPARVVGILRQAGEGLKKAHANGVIHRDIKPANIMVAEGGEVKILDFGIAGLRDAGTETGATVLGTPHYMSPEQATGKPLDGRTDIYSLGITAFHLLAGRRPFEAKARADAMMAQVKVPLPNLHDFVQCPDRLAKIVEKMCAKQQEERFQSCDQLIAALDALPRTLGGRGEDELELELAVPQPSHRPSQMPAAAAPSPPRTRPRRPRPSPAPEPPHSAAGQDPRRRRLVIGGGAGAALLILILVALAVRGAGAPFGAFRVPHRGWVQASPPAPALKKLQKNGGYGNCVFSSRQVDRDTGNADALRATFSPGDPIYGRCYFAHAIGPNKSGEVWQELWIDGVKRAQVIYDPALPQDEDQLALDVSRRHGARIGELSPGKHTVDVWIYRQPDDADTPEPLAAGELVVRN